MIKKFPFKLIDLTHTLNNKTPSWNGGCGFKFENKLDYNDCNSDVKFRVQQIKMHAGIGTHIDSPSHCIPNGATVESIALDSLVAPLLVIDIHKKMTENYKVLASDINDFENKYIQIQEGCFVAIYTGWSKYWNNPKKYHNNYLFPTVSEEAANLLISRKIIGLGIDTLSPDLPSSGFPVHNIMLGSGKYIVENISGIQQMPQLGSYVLILPIKGAGLTEAPVRMIGLINNVR